VYLDNYQSQSLTNAIGQRERSLVNLWWSIVLKIGDLIKFFQNASSFLLFYSFTPLLLYSLTPLLFYSSTPLLLYSFTPLLLYSFTPLLLYSFTLLLLYSWSYQRLWNPGGYRLAWVISSKPSRLTTVPYRTHGSILNSFLMYRTSQQINSFVVVSIIDIAK